MREQVGKLVWRCRRGNPCFGGGGDAVALAVDVSSGEEISKACEELLLEHECIDALVNNAGITRDNLLFRMEEADWNDASSTPT